jgi:thymidylate synthase
MPELVIDDMQVGYIDLVNYVVEHGERRAPRGLPTRDVKHMTVILTNPARSLTEYVGRKASTRLAALEALEVVAGRSYPAIKSFVAPRTSQFLSSDGQAHGAYGPRLYRAMIHVVNRLSRDVDTRQAVANIYDSRRDLEPGLVDVPCNVLIGYDVHDGKLDAWTIVRSNDVWWGVAHDVFTFTTLQRTVAAFLGLEVGTYTLTARSMHIYESVLGQVGNLHAPTRAAAEPPPVIIPALSNGWGEVQDVANGLVRGRIAQQWLENAGLQWWTDVASTWLETPA